MPPVPAVVAVTFLAACAHAGHAPPAEARGAVEATLREQTLALFDAVTHGDASVWDRYLDPQISYVSEAGDIETKASLLPQITPLPDGITGSIALASFAVQQFGDVAVVIHRDAESEDYFGHPIAAEYLTTDTWRRTPDGWRLIERQVLATLTDPPAIALPPAQLDEYAGSYRLSPAITFTIRRDGDHLIGERTGRPAVTLAAEARDVFFVAGQPRSRKIFARDATGRITSFADRREARDIVWSRE